MLNSTHLLIVLWLLQLLDAHFTLSLYKHILNQVMMSLVLPGIKYVALRG